MNRKWITLCRHCRRAVYFEVDMTGDEGYPLAEWRHFREPEDEHKAYAMQSVMD